MNIRIYCTPNREEYDIEKIKNSYVEYLNKNNTNDTNGTNDIIKFHGYDDEQFNKITKIFENVKNEKDFLSRTVNLGIHRICIITGTENDE